ncbi:hypothetical protein [Marinobacter sp.]|uniref:hypothetical protein n=1 Tax=Marinobacter sp. TaxID=50741 RepID=UPI0019CCEA4B|nr:hypothetical protein [Marinobacter sp.]MBD3657806.1 hypothetical protein [Marinobacter sp.]
MNQVADLFQEHEEIKRRRSQLQALAVLINSLAFEVNFRGLAFTDCHFSPTSGCFAFEVRPVDTESFRSCFRVTVFVDIDPEFLDSFSESVRDLELVIDFLRGLLAHGKPMKAYRPDESQELVA